LGSDLGLAILEYAKLGKTRVSVDLAMTVLTFEYVANLYMEEVVPTKALATTFIAYRRSATRLIKSSHARSKANGKNNLPLLITFF
jgi:hypothetical protein